MSDSPTAPLRILLVEDSPYDAQLIILQLEKDRTDVEYKRVETEEEFIAALSWTPDLILSDYTLPSFDGLRALRILQKQKLDIPFILVSGTVSEETIVDVFKQGANDYVLKDRLARLSSAIVHVLEQKHLREEKRRSDEALRASEERLNLFFAQSLDGFFFMMLDEPVCWDDTVDKEKVLDYVFAHQHITKINDAMLAQYRATHEQFLGLTPNDLFAHDLTYGRQVWRQFFDTGHLDIETDERRFDGTPMWVEGDYVCLYDNEGRITGHFGIQRDVTKRKQAEEALSSRERYLALLNTLTRDILISTDFESTFHTLAFDIKKIINADDCYIFRWEEEKQKPIPVTTTAELDFSFSDASLNESMIRVIESILTAGHVLTADNVHNSPLIDASTARQFPVYSAIGIPLIAGGHKLGVVFLAFSNQHQFTQEEIERSEQAGNQVALALWEFQQSQEIQHRFKESNALAKIGRALSETEHVGTDQVLQLIVDSARELILQAEEGVIHLLDVEMQMLIPRAISGFDMGSKTSEPLKIRYGEGVAGEVMRTGKTINLGDINASDLFLVKDSQPTFRSLLVAPVQSGRQQIGTISVQSSSLGAFSARDAELLNALSIQAAIAIENTRLFENTQQRLREMNALYKISQGLAASLDADELIKDVVELLQKNFQYYNIQIYLLDPLSGDLVFKRGSGKAGVQLSEQGYHLPRGTGIIGHVIETGAPFFTNNVNDVVFYFRNPFLPETQSELTVPIKVEGKVVGVLDIQQTSPHQLTEGDLQLMIAVAEQLAVSLQKAKLYGELQTALQQEQAVRSQLIQSERLALVGRLLASVSHELNNPLQAIQNALFLLKEETGLSSQGHQDLDIVLSETERMAALFERLRSAYRPIHITDLQPVQLNSLIEDVYALIGTHMRHKDIVFEFIPDPNLAPVPGISDQLRQVTLNLFLNAVEVMSPGGILTVQTQNLPKQKEVLLSVKDTGAGIDPKILPRIFDPFITSKQNGTGLGLTITRDIIEQHHGRIEAKNNPEGGASFNIWLPTKRGGK